MKIVFDEFGPEYIVEVYDPKLKYKGILVIDNLTLGIGKGGIRISPTVDVEELSRLARAMTLKNALYGLPFGGAKSGIILDPREVSIERKKEIIESFAKFLKPFCPKYYIAGPDINTGEKEMEWWTKAIGSWKAATGKPANLCLEIFGDKWKKCGIPHEYGSTGFGVAWAAKIALGFAGLAPEKSSAAIAGFGNVGSFAFEFLEKMGVKIVSVSDEKGAIFNKDGLDFSQLIKLKNEGKSVINYSPAKKIEREKIYELAVDILIPASVPDVINDKNIKNIKAKVIVEGANIPIREEFEEKLYQKGAVVVPDIAANAGGIISSLAELQGYHREKMFEIVKNKISKITELILKESKEKNIYPRKIAIEIAKEKIRAADKRKQSKLNNLILLVE